jgi:uncharacterized protein YdeI (YjbR/CyaY-like superfamily)
VNDGPRIHAETRAEWRAWLAENHRQPGGAWLVSWKRATGKPFVPYAEAVEEALCFGWIDGVYAPGDAERSAQWFAPRRRGGTWAKSNKERVERLIAAGLMTEAGLAAIDRARADGSWTALDTAEALEMPDDLAAALDATPGAREGYEAYSPSGRKTILFYVTGAKRPETRARRIADLVPRISAREPAATLFVRRRD